MLHLLTQHTKKIKLTDYVILCDYTSVSAFCYSSAIIGLINNDLNPADWGSDNSGLVIFLWTHL